MAVHVDELLHGHRHDFHASGFNSMCVEAVLLPLTNDEPNITFGCYGCRAATDIGEDMMFMGVPTHLLPMIAQGAAELWRRRPSPTRVTRFTSSPLCKTRTARLRRRAAFVMRGLTCPAMMFAHLRHGRILWHPRRGACARSSAEMRLIRANRIDERRRRVWNGRVGMSELFTLQACSGEGSRADRLVFIQRGHGPHSLA